MSDPIASVTMEAQFQSLDGEGILRYVAERRSEDLNLDFKLAPSAFSNRDERKALARAISGFANASGGLIVWGIDARSGEDDVDCAQEIVPLEDPALFMSRLSDHAGRATSPSVDGVLHRLVEGDTGSFALSYVPESLTGPHMAKHGENRYYKRSGASFLVMEPFEIADMFGRRQRPSLQVLFSEREGGRRIMVSLLNNGRGMASAPYLGLRLPGGYRLCSSGSGQSQAHS